MSDIIYTTPWYCDDCESFHLTHYWAYDDGTYSKCDVDGNHDDCDEEDVPSFEEQEKAWCDYYRYCLETGTDPLHEFCFPNLRVTEQWQFIISPSILGPVLRRARRATRDGKRFHGRGLWFEHEQIPEYLADFFEMEYRPHRWHPRRNSEFFGNFPKFKVA